MDDNLKHRCGKDDFKIPEGKWKLNEAEERDQVNSFVQVTRLHSKYE